jgi:hypothetical protein
MDEDNDSKPSSVTNFSSHQKRLRSPLSGSAASTKGSPPVPPQIPIECLYQLRESCTLMFQVLSTTCQIAHSIYAHTDSLVEGGSESASLAECSAFQHLCQVMEDTAEDLAAHSRALYGLTMEILASPPPSSSEKT